MTGLSPRDPPPIPPVNMQPGLTLTRPCRLTSWLPQSGHGAPPLPYACSPGIDTHTKPGLAKTKVFTMIFEAWYVETIIFTMILKPGMQQL